MKTLYALPLVALAACAAPENSTGSVVGFNGDMVTISGLLNVRDRDIVPTAAIQAQADATCGGAAMYQGWVDDPYDLMVRYNFTC